jgi:biopolymer transport protein ExbD
MLPRWRQPPKLLSDSNTPQFASVMSMVVFTLLLFFMTAPTYHHSISYDLAKVKHPLPMRGADREDAIKVFILRDGQVFFGTDRVNPADLSQRIVDRLKDHSTERKVYVVADMRATWGSIKPVLDGVRAAGVLRIAFLVDQRRAAPHI